jgi:molybdopterin-guanine dinucleotide biosynthesis protein
LNVRCPYISGLLKELAAELANYKLDFVLVEEFRLKELGTEWAVDFSFLF